MGAFNLCAPLFAVTLVLMRVSEINAQNPCVNEEELNTLMYNSHDMKPVIASTTVQIPINGMSSKTFHD